MFSWGHPHFTTGLSTRFTSSELTAPTTHCNNSTHEHTARPKRLEPTTYRLIPREDDYRKTCSRLCQNTARNNQENRPISSDIAIDLNPLTNASIDLRENRKAHQIMQTNQTSLGLRTPAHNRTSTQVPTRSRRRPRPKRRYQH